MTQDMSNQIMTITPTTTARQFGLPKQVLSLRQTTSFLTANSPFAYGGLLRSLLIILIFLLTGVTGVWGAQKDYWFFIVNKSGKIVTYAKANLEQTNNANGDQIPAAIKSVNATNWRLYNGDQIASTLTIIDPLTTKPANSYIIDCSDWGDVTLVGSPTQMSTLADCESSTKYPNYIFVFCDYDETSVPDLMNGTYYTMKYRGNATSSYAYYDQTTQWVKNTGTSSVTNPENDTKYLWCFKAAVVNGEIDPYDVKIYNASVGTGMTDHFVANPLDDEMSGSTNIGVGSGPENEYNWLRPASVLTTNRIASYYVATSYYLDQYNITGNPAYNKGDKTQIFYNLWAEYNNDSDTRSGITSQNRFMRNHSGRRMYSSIILTQVSKKYIIVDAAGNTIVQALTLSNTLDVPDVIKSPFASYTYYSSKADAIAGSNPINSVTSTTIYVRYTTPSGGDLDLNGGTNYFICTNGNYLYASNSTTLGIESSLSDPSSNTRKWKITGNDAYQLTLQNADNNQYVTYNVSSGETVPTLSGTGSKFFLHQSNTGQYEVVAITPGYYSTNYYSLGVASSTLKLYSNSNYPMGDDEVQSFIYPQPTCATPVISFDNTTNQITITSATEGATIHYTTNGDTPTESSPSTPNPFTINAATTVKAIATQAGYLTSEVATLAIAQVATPSIQNNGSNAISITSTTPGATIYYTTDGSTPTTSSTLYTEPLTENVSGVTIKAIAVKENMIPSAVGSGSVTLQCASPVIVRNGNNGFTVSCPFPSSGVTIYYTIDGSTPTTSSNSTTSGGTVTATLPVTVKAMAVATGYNNSTVATVTVSQGMGGDGSAASPYTIENQSDITDFITKANTADGASKHYKVIATDPLDFNGVSAITQPFSGTFDGGFHTISNLGHALFNTVNGGTVKNVILKNVTISSGTNVGAICNEATGASRIYNCGILATTEYDTDGNITGFSGSSIGGSGNVGGIVGLLSGNARVINCYSYATITGGTTVGGIVGNIGYGANGTITQGDVSTKPMVVNCMFYGDITGGSNIAPVYGGASGAMIKNDADTGVNPYCYFRGKASFNNISNFPNIESYKRSWPAEEKNLTRFEYYRSILNSNRRLCTWWVNGTNETAPNDDDVSDVGIAKWVLDPSIAPYPILKKWGKYPSIINPDPEKRIDPSTKTWINRDNASSNWEKHGVPDTEGQILGGISVSINAGDHHNGTASRTINITAMDKEYHDYCYGKIQLPYYNEIFGNPDGSTWSEKYGDNYGEYVVTGWEITATDGSDASGHSFSADWQDGYNFADRKCVSKDLYGTSGRVFAQGGYYYVPEGVSAITITAHWGKAVYLANRGYSIDRVNVTNSGYKLDKAFASAGTIKNTKDGIVYESSEYKFQGQKVYDDLQNAIKALGVATVSNSIPSISVYDQAIVLIGNHQVKNGGTKNADVYSIGYNLDNSWHPFTFMSADFDFDNEPDYCLQLQFRDDIDRPGIQPIRFDFLPVVELGLAVRHDKLAYAIGIFIPQGHFEITETSFMRSTQFEWDCGQHGGSNRIANNVPVIFNGGEFEQLTVRYPNSNGPGNTGARTGYFLLGGHLWFHRFAPGAHPHKDNLASPRLCAVNAIGGDFPEFYLSGLYKPGLSPRDNQGNPHCYIDGGNFGTIHGAGYDKIKGSVTFKVNHSIIGEFYGGGINGTNPVGGNIDVYIDNSQVTKYCGGPEVGIMTGKTVTTHATGTTFGVYYGGGNGGNTYYRALQWDGDKPSSNIQNWNSDDLNWDGFTPLGVKDDNTTTNKGYHAEYEFEVFNQSNGVSDKITQRGFIKWIQFGITTTGNVSNTLTDCTVNTNFFGGGNLATVNGTVTSKLTNTTVNGNVFGAGYSAAIPKFTVHDKANKVFPSMDFAGTITEGYIPNKQEDGKDIEYEWTNNLDGVAGHDADYMKAHPDFYKMVEENGTQVKKWYCYTWNPLVNLGVVTGAVKLTITTDGGTSVIGTTGDNNTGHVYGGGDESAVKNDTNPANASTTVNISGNTQVLGNVYGGGNQGLVSGTTTVNIRAVEPNP